MPRKPYTHHKKRKPFGRGFKRGHKCLDWVLWLSLTESLATTTGVPVGM